MEATLATWGATKPGAAGATTAGEPGGPGSLPATLDLVSGNVPHSAVELANLARASLRVADWFVVGTGAGHLLDGLWYCQGVRHRWGVDPADPEREQTVRRYEADVTVVRNALGGLP